MNLRNLSLLVVILSSAYTLTLAQRTPGFRTFLSENVTFEYPENWHVNDKSTGQMQQFNLVPDKGNVLIMVIVYRRDISTRDEFNQLLETASKPRLDKIKKAFSKSILSEACLKSTDGLIPGHRIDGIYLGNKSSAESYSMALQSKFINLVYMKEDSAATTADSVWNKLKDTLEFKDMNSDHGFTSFDPSSLAVINGKARKLPKPVFYPSLPKLGDTPLSVNVRVRVVIDKDGNVIEAKGVSGNSRFFEASVDAAKRAKFSPTFICGELQQKIAGIIVYNYN